jgi:hypothetical protein
VEKRPREWEPNSPRRRPLPDTGSHAARQRRYPRQHECGCRPGLDKRRARRQDRGPGPRRVAGDDPRTACGSRQTDALEPRKADVHRASGGVLFASTGTSVGGGHAQDASNLEPSGSHAAEPVVGIGRLPTSARCCNWGQAAVVAANARTVPHSCGSDTPPAAGVVRTGRLPIRGPLSSWNELSTLPRHAFTAALPRKQARREASVGTDGVAASSPARPRRRHCCSGSEPPRSGSRISATPTGRVAGRGVESGHDREPGFGEYRGSWLPAVRDTQPTRSMADPRCSARPPNSGKRDSRTDRSGRRSAGRGSSPCWWRNSGVLRAGPPRPAFARRRYLARCG